jgi:hypothetical protein
MTERTDRMEDKGRPRLHARGAAILGSLPYLDRGATVRKITAQDAT